MIIINMKEVAIKKGISITTIISKMINQFPTIINHPSHLAINMVVKILPLITIILNHIIIMIILINKTSIIIILTAEQ